MRERGWAKRLPIITTRHDSFIVEYHSSHRQVSGTQWAEIRPCSRVCEWDRNEQNQSRFNRAPIGFRDLGVLTIHQVFGLAYLRKSSVYVANTVCFIYASVYQRRNSFCHVHCFFFFLFFDSLLIHWFSSQKSLSSSHQAIRTAQGQHLTLSDMIVALITVILAQTSPSETTTPIED